MTNLFLRITKEIYNLPIVDYFDTKVYCKGYFRDPTKEEIRNHSCKPYKMFQPIEKHGWCISFYDRLEVELFKGKR